MKRSFWIWTALGLLLAACAPGAAAGSGHATAARPALPEGPRAPDLTSPTWLNSNPLGPADLRGKVVLVDFWTFG